MCYVLIIGGLILSVLTPGQAQDLSANPRADSLIRQLTDEHTIENRLKLLGDISWAYLSERTELEKGKSYADSLRILADSYNFERWSKRARFYYGAYERFRGNHEKALEHLIPFVKYSTKAGDSAWVADGLFQLSVCYTNMGDYTRALNTSYRFIAICEHLKEPWNVAHAQLGVGNIFFNSLKFTEALQVFNEALEIYDSLGRERATANVYLGMGNVYTKVGEFTEARDSYQKALNVFQKYDMPYGVALTFANLAFMYDGMAQYDTALIYHLKGLRIRESLPNKDDLTRSLIGVGRGYKAVGNFILAEKYLKRARELATDIGSKPMLRDIYINLAELAEKKGIYRDAFSYLSLHKLMNDSILNEENSRQLSELRTKYETESKNQQIAILRQQREIQLQQNKRQADITKAVTGGLVLIVLLGGSIVYILRQRIRNQKIIAAKNEEIKDANFSRQLSNLELKALRAQINPHFLFNCMNSINKMILEGDGENASRYLTKFAIMVRQILENSESDQVPLSNELAMLKSYIQLEELRLKSRISCNIVLAEDLDPDETFLPPMILQPFVENAIWHGLMHRQSESEGNILIKISHENGKLHCTIEDNGVGRERSKLLAEDSVWKSKSMGMKITEERLRFLSKEKIQELIQVTDLKDTQENPLGTRIDIQLPV